MNSDQEKIISMLNSLAGAVVTAIRSGKAEERTRIAETLRAMDEKMPAVSEDTAGAKEFLRALIGLLEGSPVSAEGLEEPYAGMYSKIAAQALASARPGTRPGPDEETREFLTQLSATVVLVARNGAPKDKEDLAGKLHEIAAGMPETQKDAAAFVNALTGLLGEGPVDAGPLPAPYANFFRKVMDSIRSSSH